MKPTLDCAGAGHGVDVDRIAAKRFGQNTRFITEGSLIFFTGRRPNYPGSRTCVLRTAGSRRAAFQARSCWSGRAVRQFGGPRGAHGSGHYGLLFFSTTPNSISQHPYPLWSKVSRPTHQPWRVTQAQETLGATYLHIGTMPFLPTGVPLCHLHELSVHTAPTCSVCVPYPHCYDHEKYCPKQAIHVFLTQ